MKCVFSNIFLHRQVVGTSPNLTITVSTETAGKYICKASVVGFPEISAMASVYLKGPPTITSARRQYGITGVNTRVECTAFSVPKVKISFKKTSSLLFLFLLRKYCCHFFRFSIYFSSLVKKNTGKTRVVDIHGPWNQYEQQSRLFNYWRTIARRHQINIDYKGEPIKTFRLL